MYFPRRDMKTGEVTTLQGGPLTAGVSSSEVKINGTHMKEGGGYDRNEWYRSCDQDMVRRCAAGLCEESRGDVTARVALDGPPETQPPCLDD